MKKEMDLINRYQKEIILLVQANSLLNWDEETYMPHEGIKGRSEQAALLSKLTHKKMISNEFFSAVKKLRKKELESKDGIMVDKLFKEISKSRKLPEKFVEELSRATTLASSAWRKARKEKKFEIFKPHLEKIVELKRRQAKYISLRGHIYNSLLDDYEEGMTAERLIPVFDKLKNELILLLRKIEKSENYKRSKDLPAGKFPREEMEKFLRDVAERIGLDKEKSRIDISEHPFTTKIGVDDVRITTNYRKDPMFSVGSTMHEAGHALYELQMPQEDAYNFLGGSPSLGLHESQSRFWENMIGKSKSFWKFYFPKFKEKFKLNMSLDDWCREINVVKPGKIRIESDEVHYVLHIILRFEIELGLIEGSIKVKDLPDIWNKKMKEFFGVKIDNDVEGCLQDVHWSGGLIGYFPTYALGTIYAAQIYNSLRKENKNVEMQIEKGDFSGIRKWLGNKIHKYGARFLADEIIKKACGEGLNPEVYIKYLNEKYGRIYGLSS